MKFPAGRYVIGDLQSVLPPYYWRDLVSNSDGCGNACALSSCEGDVHFMYGTTAYGSGNYLVENGAEEAEITSSGIIGIVTLTPEIEEMLIGHEDMNEFMLIEFDKPSLVYCSEGFFKFGKVSITTDDPGMADEVQVAELDGDELNFECDDSYDGDSDW